MAYLPLSAVNAEFNGTWKEAFEDRIISELTLYRVNYHGGFESESEASFLPSEK